MKFLRDAHSLPVGRVEQGESRLGKFLKIFLKNFLKNFFSGSYYRVAGGGYFTTFLKQNFENLICDGKLFENFELNRKYERSLERDFRREIY